VVISAPSSHPPSNGSLAAAIGDAGRRASVRTLALILLLGGLALLGILIFGRGHRLLAVPLVMPTAFAVWGLAERIERILAADPSETNVERLLLRALRVCMVALGAVAAMVAAFLVTFAIAGPAPKL